MFFLAKMAIQLETIHHRRTVYSSKKYNMSIYLLNKSKPLTNHLLPVTSISRSMNNPKVIVKGQNKGAIVIDYGKNFRNN